ncbi:hypothetical protein OCU04_012468 [Sclerotinia nivalis]|uniref:Uncharacterized protein n=1 Tax=Sclerotinia nivalis TaxID=352851 RepID=A0A9X0A8N2_9HELO|nr:hypothetical protein OCU04_012468 [Sclerotinia nivalis]
MTTTVASDIAREIRISTHDREKQGTEHSKRVWRNLIRWELESLQTSSINFASSRVSLCLTALKMESEEEGDLNCAIRVQKITLFRVFKIFKHAI